MVAGASGYEANKGCAYVYERNVRDTNAWDLVTQLTASDGTANDLFGASVTVAGDVVVIGAYGDETNRGSAYVYERNVGGTNVWGEVKKLTASDGATNDHFGASLAVAGDAVVIGAYGDETNRGSAYVYERNVGGTNVWGEVKKLTASDGATNDLFGASVAVAGDAVVIGARGDETDRGSAYVYERNVGGTNVWGEVKKLTASDGAVSDKFGWSIAVAGDVVMIGAQGDDSSKGAAYVYERNVGGTNTWGQVKKLTASDGAASDQFGVAVAVAGDVVVVGANGDDASKGASYLYERNAGGTNAWGQVKKLTASDGVAGDDFGYSVAVAGDVVVVGAFSDDAIKGSAYVYERNAGGTNAWGQVNKLTSSDGEGGDSNIELDAAAVDLVEVGAASYRNTDDEGK
ncbi:MAG: hypothetical protein V1929_06580, partial [bacterium]